VEEPALILFSGNMHIYIFDFEKSMNTCIESQF
jgi:hypothetical protein